MSVLADIRTGAYGLLSGIVTQRHTARPASIGSLSIGWVDEARIDLLHDAGTRQWNGEVDVWLVAGGLDNEEAQTAVDALAEAYVNACSDAPHVFGANTVAEPVRVRTGTADFGEGVSFPASIVTVGRFVFQEGR